MNIETVLFPIHITQSHDTLLSVAELCLSENKHLTVLLFDESLSPPLMTIGETASAELWAQQMLQKEKELQTEIQKIKTLLENTKVRFDAKYEIGDGIFVDDAIGIHAAYADIVLVQRPTIEDNLNSFAKRLYHGALFVAGKPLFVFDSSAPKTLKFNTVLIAWNGKRSASRAVSESVPLLKNASNVYVLTVDADEQNDSGSDQVDWDLSAYLSRHQINITADARESMSNKVSAVIQKHALEVGADLIVCGSYGRSPLRERLFGGTTGEILNECALPVLLVH